MRALFLLVTIALVAGCASDPPSTAPTAKPSAPVTPTTDVDDDDPIEGADEEAGDADASPAPRVVTTFVNGTITSVGAGSSEPVGFCCPTLARSGENLAGTFSVEAGILGVVVELTWTDPTFDLDLWVYGPDYEQVTPPEINGTSISGSRGHYWYDNSGQAGSPDGHVTIAIVDPESLALAGEWGWDLTSKTSNGTPFSVAVSLFYGEPPADGFSALAA